MSEIESGCVKPKKKKQLWMVMLVVLFSFSLILFLNNNHQEEVIVESVAEVKQVNIIEDTIVPTSVGDWRVIRYDDGSVETMRADL